MTILKHFEDFKLFILPTYEKLLLILSNHNIYVKLFYIDPDI